MASSSVSVNYKWKRDKLDGQIHIETTIQYSAQKLNRVLTYKSDLITGEINVFSIKPIRKNICSKINLPAVEPEKIEVNYYKLFPKILETFNEKSEVRETTKENLAEKRKEIDEAELLGKKIKEIKEEENKQQNRRKYVYENISDLCMACTFPPLSLRNALMIGNHYLVHCITLLRKSKISNNELYFKNLLSQIECIESSFIINNYQRFLLKMIFEIPSMPDVHIKSLIMSIFNRVKLWPKRFKTHANLAVHLQCDLDIFNDRKVNNYLTSLIHALNTISKTDVVDILWISFECIPVGYIEAIKNSDFLKALQIFHNYYERCSVLLFNIIDKIDNINLNYIFGIKAPSWMIPSGLNPCIAEIYRPLIIPIASKLMNIPTSLKLQSCLTFSEGAGLLAKAMNGNPLMIPSLFEMEVNMGNQAIAFSDIISTQLSLKPYNSKTDRTVDLLKIKSVNDYIDYYNCLHVEEGYQSNRHTSKVLIKSKPILTPIHVILQYRTLHSIARKVIESTVFSHFLRIIHEILDQIIDAEAQGFLNISEKGLVILSKCKKKFQCQKQPL